MKRAAAIVGAALALAAGVAWFVLRGHTWTFTVTQAQIEEALAKRFPVRKSYLVLIDVHYENPRVRLTDASDEIGIRVDVRTNVAVNGTELRGGGDLATKIAYDAEHGRFVLHDARLVELRVDGLKDEHLSRVKDVANVLALEQVAGIPVYTLRPTDVKQALARLVLKSVTVRNGALVIEVGV